MNRLDRSSRHPRKCRFCLCHDALDILQAADFRPRGQLFVRHVFLGYQPKPPKLSLDLALLYSLPVGIQHLVSRPFFERILNPVEPYVYGAMAALMYLEAGPETSFIYFQF